MDYCSPTHLTSIQGAGLACNLFSLALEKVIRDGYIDIVRRSTAAAQEAFRQIERAAQNMGGWSIPETFQLLLLRFTAEEVEGVKITLPGKSFVEQCIEHDVEVDPTSVMEGWRRPEYWNAKLEYGGARPEGIRL